MIYEAFLLTYLLAIILAERMAELNIAYNSRLFRKHIIMLYTALI